MSKIYMIYASDLKGGIGKDKDLAWNFRDYPKDMEFFVSTTLGVGTLVTGRVNFESMGSKGLKNRFMFVLTNNKDQAKEFNPFYEFTSVEVVESFIESTGGDVIIIGGAEIYKLYEDKADVIYKTTIKKEFDCDTYYTHPSSFKLEEVIYENEELKIEKYIK